MAGHETAVGEADGLVGVEAGQLQLARLGEVGGVGGVAVLHPAPVLGLEPCTPQGLGRPLISYLRAAPPVKAKATTPRPAAAEARASQRKILRWKCPSCPTWSSTSS